MNKYLFFVTFPLLFFGSSLVRSQSLTYIPDQNFEQELINLGYDATLDNYVATSAIDTVTSLNLDNLSISSLEGIDDFISLSSLSCSGNLLTSLDLSQNIALTYLDASSNVNMSFFNMANGANQNISSFNTTGNTSLSCIGVDDISWSQLNWTNIDPSTSFTQSYLTSVISSCNSYEWNDSTYVFSGTYMSYGGADTALGASACDSVFILRLTINSSSSSVDSVDVCDDYVWNGITYDQSGVYDSVLTNVAGCDSLATLVLTIRYSVDSVANISACDQYTWNDSTYTSSTMYSVSNLINTAGCDSTATLDLNISYSSFNYDTVSVCDAYTWNGQTYTSSGLYGYLSTNSNGCPHFDTLSLTIDYSDHIYDTADVCDEYVWYGDVYHQSGVYDSTFTNVAGCDSVITLVLTVRKSTVSSHTVSACDSYFWADSNLTSTGIYTHYTTNVDGCDSTATLDLTVNYSTGSTLDTVVCEQFTWNGMTLTSSGISTFISTNASGCPHVDTLVLSVENAVSSTDTVIACGHYTWNGIVYTESGVYDTLLLSNAGCDSLANLVLTVGNPTNSIMWDTACAEYTWNGMVYTESGIYVHVTTNSTGCLDTDSLVLVIDPSYRSLSSEQTATACESYEWNGVTYSSSGTYYWMGVNNEGCDSSATLILDIIPVEKPSIDHYWSTTLKSSESDFYQWYRNGEELFGETNQMLNFYQAGSYVVHIINEYGCHSMSDPFSIGEESSNINSNEDLYESKVYPTIATDFVVVEVNMMKESGYIVEIVDYQGNLVKRTNEIFNTSDRINISHLSKGMYFVNIRFQDGEFINNIITKQ